MSDDISPERRTAIIDLARRQYAGDGIEFADDADISEGEDEGCYVRGWAWVSFVDAEIPPNQKPVEEETRKLVYLMICNHRAAFMSLPLGLSGEGWDQVYTKFRKACAVSDRHPELSVLAHMYVGAEKGYAGITFSSYLASADGAWFEIYALPHHSNDDVRKLKAELRGNRDVVGMRVIRVKEWLPDGVEVLKGLQVDRDEVCPDPPL